MHTHTYTCNQTYIDSTKPIKRKIAFLTANILIHDGATTDGNRRCSSEQEHLFGFKKCFSEIITFRLINLLNEINHNIYLSLYIVGMVLVRQRSCAVANGILNPLKSHEIHIKMWLCVIVVHIKYEPMKLLVIGKKLFVINNLINFDWKFAFGKWKMFGKWKSLQYIASSIKSITYLFNLHINIKC